MKKIWLIVIIHLLINNLLIAQEFNFKSAQVVNDQYFEEVSFEFIKNKIYIPVYIDNVKYRFLLDTGSPTMVFESLFNKLRPNETLQGDMTDVNNEKINEVSHFILNSLKLGNVEFKNIPTTLIRNTFMECPGVDGIVGGNIFYNSTLSICFNREVIILTDEINKLNIKNKNKCLFKVPVNRNVPIILLNLEGLTRKGFFGDFVFDTGNPHFISLTNDYADFYESKGVLSHEIQGHGRSSYGFGGLEENQIQKKWQISSLKINKGKIRNVTARLAKMSMIGCELIKYGDVTIDYKNKSFAFEPYEDEVEYDTKSFPVDLIIVDEKLLIGIVWDKNIDISQGDQVIEIDDISYENVSVCNLLFDTILEGKNEVKLKLKKKNGEIKAIILRKY